MQSTPNPNPQPQPPTPRPPQSDNEYFSSLKYYKPLFYSGKGTPWLMTNTNWYHCLNCVVICDVLYIALLVLFVMDYQRREAAGKSGKQQIPFVWILISASLIFLFANLSTLATQLTNPGILNPSTLTDPKSPPQDQPLKFCPFCQAYVLQSMVHCRECEVCIWGMDHHCGFFNKCIGGCQKFWFYGALLFGFLAFIGMLMIGCMLAFGELNV